MNVVRSSTTHTHLNAHAPGVEATTTVTVNMSAGHDNDTTTGSAHSTLLLQGLLPVNILTPQQNAQPLYPADPEQ